MDKTRQLRSGLMLCAALLAPLPACLDQPTGDPGPGEEDPAGTTATSELTSPDVILNLAETHSGWISTGNSLSTSTVRQQGARSVQSVGTGSERFRANHLGPVDARGRRFLTFWYYVDDVSKIRKDRDAEVEISSSATVDTEEMFWNLHDLRLTNGWNFVRLQLPGSPRSASGVGINPAAIRRFRLYHYVTASVTTRIDDIRFTNRFDSPVEAGCATVAANATIEGIGVASTGTSYGAAGCGRSFVVDLKAYQGAKHDTGTVVSYAGPNTTNVAVCENTVVSAYVFRRQPHNDQYVPLADQRGFFGTRARGRMVNAGASNQICQRPYLLLDLEYPGFLPGGDYRVVMRSERVVPTGRELQKTAFATPQPPGTASSNRAFARRLAEDSQARTTAVLKARSAALTKPNHYAMACRLAQFRHLLLETGGVVPALTALGASATTAQNYLSALGDMAGHLCRPFPTDTAPFDGAIRTLSTVHRDALNQIAAHLGIDVDMAAGVVEQLLTSLAKDMVGRCQPNTQALADYIFAPASAGSPPQVLEQSLFVTCTRSAAATHAGARVQEVANALATGNRGFRQCVGEVVNKELADPCTDPRGEPIVDYENPVPAESIEECLSRTTQDEQIKCIDAVQYFERLRRDRAGEPSPGGTELPPDDETPPPGAGYSPCKGLEGPMLSLCETAQRFLDSDATPSATGIQQMRGALETAEETGFWGKFVDGLAEVAEEVVDGIIPDFITDLLTNTLEAGAAGVAGATKVQEGELRKACEIIEAFGGKHDKCEGLEKLDEPNKKRCVGETLGTRAISYPTGDGPMKGSRPTNVFDSLNACWCEHVGMPIFDVTCTTEEERRREACVHNPWGPDDAPRSECLGYLRASSGLDDSALRGGMCLYIQPNCDHRGFIDANGACGCWEPNVDPNPALACRDANVVNCGPDSVFDQRSCGCQPLGGGEFPWGDDPLCGNDPQFSPGGRDRFITLRADDLFTSRFVDLGGQPTVDFHMVRAGGFVPVVSPALFTRAFDKLGTQLELDIKMPAVVGASGYRGAVQASCTSANVTNHLIGQRNLQDLALGGVHTLAFSLSPEDLELCAGGDSAWRVEFGVDSDSRTVERLGIGAIRFAGTPVPVDEPLPRCPLPPPDGIPLPNPPPPQPPVSAPTNIFGDTIADPTSWTFSTGDVVQVR